MKQNHNRRQHRAALGLFCVFSLFASESYAAPAAITSRTANIDSVQLHYLIAGSGPAVLFLHGYTQISRMWRPIIPLLAEKFTVIAVDLPGTGDSSIPADNKIDMITAAYSRPGRMHAGWAYFVSWPQLAKDFAQLSQTKLTMPVLSIGGDKSLGNELAAQMKLVATDVTVVVLSNTGHWIFEEKPKETIDALVKFL